MTYNIPVGTSKTPDVALGLRDANRIRVEFQGTKYCAPFHPSKYVSIFATR